MTTAASITSPQARVLGVVNKPAANMSSTQARILAPVEEMADINAVQARILAVVRGRIGYPNVRAWTFTLDGHDYYILRLGTSSTLVYDLTTNQWYIWGSGTGDLWYAYNGCNWNGANSQSGGYGSNIVVGDDTFGTLYFLDPEYDYDDAGSYDGTSSTFQRVVEGQVINTSYNGQRCYGVEVLGSIGDVTSPTLTNVTLDYSDDRGKTFATAGTITVPTTSYDARLSWRSLCNIPTPGRLFKITDYGALRRIDSLEMEDGK